VAAFPFVEALMRKLILHKAIKKSKLTCMTTKPATVDDYIATFPVDVQTVLEQVRSVIRKVVPQAEETISYGVPTFKLNGTYVIYFAGYKNHISIYPAPRENEAFKEELARYKGGKGTVQFPLSQAIPLSLISKIAKYLLTKNLERTGKKK
jgi:uncharacterized protein YdhG (YjbR/CyaY superfamily)